MLSRIICGLFLLFLLVRGPVPGGFGPQYCFLSGGPLPDRYKGHDDNAWSGLAGCSIGLRT